MYDSEPMLSVAQRKILWSLVRKEAVSLGYSTIYTESNRKEWPRRLKTLAAIARKLRA